MPRVRLLLSVLLVLLALPAAAAAAPSQVMTFEAPDELMSDADRDRTLDEIAETILPRTKTPGAKDAGAGAFMATFVSDCYTARQQATFRAGLADIDKRAGGRFVSLAPQARTELLRALDAEARKHAVEVTETGTAEAGEPMPHYFTMFKQLTIFGFFTSKVGATEVLRYVAVPGRYDGDLAYVPGTPAWGTS